LAASISVSAKVTATRVTYPNTLLAIARRLIDQGLFNIAIVTSHMACEVAAERAFDAAYAAKKLEPLGEAVDGLMNGNNLAKDKHRKLYNALTGTELEKQSFWPQFKSASEKRNSIVHRGGHANKNEAEAALQGANELVTYLKQM
jgi:energy-converting hydrogenase Eha subunit C